MMCEAMKSFAPMTRIHGLRVSLLEEKASGLTKQGNSVKSFGVNGESLKERIQIMSEVGGGGVYKQFGPSWKPPYPLPLSNEFQQLLKSFHA